MRFVSTFLFIVLLFVPAAFSQSHDHHHGDEQLGEVHFPVSCKETVQKDFDRAVALLHSFWYAEAERSFNAIAKSDPGCGMAYWGVAMSNFHPLWYPPTPDEFQRGKAAAEQAGKTGAGTDRERELIAAIAVFYDDSQKADHRTRAQAYANAMESVYGKYPDDLEISAFYGLSLLGTAVPTDKTYAVQKKAAGVLDKLVDRAPRHPGVAHYIIHSFDYPALAELALPAARAYAKIAPSSPHAQHMPSHIFTRLGLWQESIASNIASAETAKKHVAKTHPGAGSFDQLHAMDYLVYAYLQTGQTEKAQQVTDEALAMQKLDQATLTAAYSFGAMPARMALERQKWADAANLTAKPEWVPWEKFPFAEANIHFARGVGGARSGNLKIAKEAETRLIAMRDSLLQKNDKYFADQVEVMRLQTSAWIAFASKDSEKAVELMQAAAALEDTTEKHPVTPGAVVPAREALGQLYLELKKPDAALAEFENSLKTAPNRHNSIAGAQEAARLTGNTEAEQKYSAKLKSM